MSPKPSIPLFSYGTLRQREVQLATYGRLLDGTPDTLSSYRLDALAIADPDVVRLSGKAVHHIARKSSDSNDRIAGFLFLITAEELAATDVYEVKSYARAEVMLDSGLRAFAYVGPDWE